MGISVSQPFGTWWRRQPPYVIRKWEFAPYKADLEKAVQVCEDVLVPTGRAAELYGPFEEPDLLDAFLDVAQERLKPVEFADRFGPLGYNHIVPDENQCPLGGDPIAWFMAHARTALTITELIRRVKEAEESIGGCRHLANYFAEDIAAGPYALGGVVKDLPWLRKMRPPPPEAIRSANHVLLFLLNTNLGNPLPIDKYWSKQAGFLDTRRCLQLVDGKFRSVFTLHALVQVIYWKLADQLGCSSIRQCVECGRIFTHADSRIRFCPPSKGKQISRCKTSLNQREFRKQHARRRNKR